MRFRPFALLGLVALGLSAVACSAESGGAVTSDDNEVRAAASAGLSTAELQKQLAKAVDGLEYMSESDYPFDVFVAPGAAGAPIDAAAVKAAFNDKVSTKNTEKGTALKDMIGSEERPFDEWMSNDTSDIDESDADAVKYAEGMKKAYGLMKANLKDLKVLLIAEESLEKTEDVGFLHCFIVGRAADGSLVALHTGLVWT
jgi:cytochrome c556